MGSPKQVPSVLLKVRIDITEKRSEIDLAIFSSGVLDQAGPVAVALNTLVCVFY
jgi:hypothetical protein